MIAAATLLRRRFNGDGSRATAKVSLGSDDLVVVSAEVQTDLGPGVKVRSRVDGAAGALVAADGPVLLKGGRANDGGLVGAGADVDVVDAAVARHLALLASSRRRVVGAKVFDNVVLDERVLGPSVHGEVAVAVGVVRARVFNGAFARKLSGLVYMHLFGIILLCVLHLPTSSWVPSLAAYKVAAVAPADAVLTTSFVGVGDVGAAIRPPRVVVSIWP